jgi:hypothetical protein
MYWYCSTYANTSKVCMLMCEWVWYCVWECGGVDRIAPALGWLLWWVSCTLRLAMCLRKVQHSPTRGSTKTRDVCSGASTASQQFFVAQLPRIVRSLCRCTQQGAVCRRPSCLASHDGAVCQRPSCLALSLLTMAGSDPAFLAGVTLRFLGHAPASEFCPDLC